MLEFNTGVWGARGTRTGNDAEGMLDIFLDFPWVTSEPQAGCAWCAWERAGGVCHSLDFWTSGADVGQLQVGGRIARLYADPQPADREGLLFGEELGRLL